MMKNIFKFAWRNTWRNKKRTYFTLLSVAFGVMVVTFLTSYTTGILNSAGEEMIKTQIGHIRIAHKEFLRLERIQPREYRVNDPAALKTKISGLPGIRSWCERIKFSALVNNKDINETVAVIGIDPAAANDSMGLSQLIVQGNYYDNSGMNCLVGEKLSRELGVTVNDELLVVTNDINYSTYALPFKVAGIFKTGYSNLDGHNIFIPLEKAREILDCGDSVQDILLFLKDPGKAPGMAREIEQIISPNENVHSLQVIPWETDDFIKKFLPTLELMVQKSLFLFMIIVALIILNTMLMSVMERFHEIGITKALGLRNREVVLMILVEALIVGIIGSIIGGAVGGAISAVTEHTGIDFSKLMGEEAWNKIDIAVPLVSNVIHPDFTYSILFGAVFFGVFVSLVAVLYPAYKSTKMMPVEAFRSKLKV
ncbi:MAG: ABC transporter permease [Acidobacteria bacterium]|jgi:putative ABC transport system permease protein|nr:ABC transporter permease [Acidobacteriota bacterium]